MSKRKIAFKAMSDVQMWPATLEACDRLESNPSLSDADKVLIARMRQALVQQESGETLKRPWERPVPPRDMEGVLSELECLRIEVEELRADRDRWMALYHRAANKVLSLTPQYKFRRPGPLPEPITLQGEGMSASERVISDRDIKADSMTPSEGASQSSEPTSQELWDRIPPAHRHLLMLLLNPDKLDTP